ncbi:uncharacterized protein LOC141619804 [Silene latifolia]|uniref:uncharacterized protein LOC141619804 n=1 Tax=Silene latifolia TaxID=37657 RepID=UPI003D77903C
MGMKDKVTSSGHYLFDNKPMIVKPWTRDMEMTKDDVKSVPAWVQILKLPLKFWGKGLPKIVGLIRKFIKCDAATEERTRLGYARVMVELMVDHELPAHIAFKDEKVLIIRVDIEYEWRPIKCKKCQGMGHEMEHCRKGNQEYMVTGFVTPCKRLVRMHRQEGDRSEYSGDTFGAHYYKEILTSPSKLNGTDTGVGLFGLLETKIKSKSFNRTVNIFNNWCISTNNGYHNNGRIWILWDPKLFRIQFVEYNAQLIHMKVEALVSRSVFFLTMIYAFNGIQDRTPLWDHLWRFDGQVDGLWAMAGDFNCVLSASERVGGNTPNAEIEPFRTCVADCEVVDISATGSLFTWNNKQQLVDRIYSRLDRFMINKSWSDNFPDLYSNFRHEALNREKYSDIEQSTSLLQKRVAALQELIGNDPSNMALISGEAEATKSLRDLYVARDNFMAQKAKIRWLQ